MTDFLISKNEGNPLFYCKNVSNRGKAVKNRTLLVWKNRSTSPDKIAKIVDGKHVKYKNEIISLNVFGCKITGWSAIQSYAMTRRVDNIKTLSELRDEKMKQLGMI